MKYLTRVVLAAAVALGISVPALAESINSTIPAGKQMTGQVQSIDGSTVILKTSDGGTQTYRVAPNLISALKLGTGSDVVIDGTRLRMGKVLRLGSYTAEVDLDQGGEKSYILTRETRRYLAAGDRVVITPDLRLVRADLYTLTASDLRLNSVMVASSTMMKSSSSSSSRMVMRQQPVGGASTPEAVSPVEVSSPVVGLW